MAQSAPACSARSAACAGSRPTALDDAAIDTLSVRITVAGPARSRSTRMAFGLSVAGRPGSVSPSLRRWLTMTTGVPDCSTASNGTRSLPCSADRGGT